MNLKSALLICITAQILAGQTSYSGMGSWFHPQSLAMAGGGKSLNSMEADRFNPAAVSSKSRLFSISMVRYPGDIFAESSSLLIPRQSKTLSINLRHLGYGIFEGKDSNNQSVQNYSSSDTWFSMSSTSSDTNNRYSFGWNSGLFFSNMESYQAVILTAGFGALINLPNQFAKISVSLQNVGLPIKKYTNADKSPPVALTLGASKKLAYLPLELSIDGVYLPEDNSTRIHFGGIAELPHHFKLRFGTSSMKMKQKTSYSIARDMLADSGIGLSYSDGEYAFDIGMYMYGAGGWASGLGLGIKF